MLAMPIEVPRASVGKSSTFNVATPVAWAERKKAGAVLHPVSYSTWDRPPGMKIIMNAFMILHFLGYGGSPGKATLAAMTFLFSSTWFEPGSGCL